MRVRGALLGCLTLFLAAGVARADLVGGQTKFLHGDYAGAKKELEKVDGSDRGQARLELARVHMRMGAFAEAKKLLDALVKSKEKDLSLAAEALAAELARDSGRSAEARKTLEPLAAKNADALRLQYMLGLLYRDLGDKAKASAQFQKFVDLEQSGAADLKNAEQLFYIAEGGRYLAHFEYASRSYQDALDLNPKFLEANLELGALFLEKYNVGDAEQSFDEVLKVDPHHPDAHAGMARVKLEQSYDIAAALHHIGEALAVNPRHVPSLLVRAGIEIDRNQWEQAKATLEEALAVNPKHTEARALLATIHWLRDDTKAYEALKKAVFADNPAYAEFFHIVARSAVREHRYEQAIDLEKEAVSVDPEYYEAMREIGTGYLRLGAEDVGLTWLRKAWDGDQYNARTLNTLQLFEETISKEYEFSKSKTFKWRFHKEEKDILARQVQPMIEKAYADMVARYGFTPKGPLVMEVYREPEDYSVRTVGLPNLGALGVCFGSVVTAMSPSSGNLNWAMVMWHELSHVFAIQLSNSRVPRWYTEGLSEYETILARPEWRRENDADLYVAMQEGSLPSVAELNEGFMKPNMQDVLVAYHLSSVVMEYLATKYGFPKIVEGLKLFGKGSETPEVVEKITGKKLKAFDAEFRSYLAGRLRPYKGTFYLPTSGFDDIKKLEIETGARPKVAASWSRLALGHYYEGNSEEADKAVVKALALDPEDRLAIYVKAELMVRHRQLAEAKALYEKLIAAGADSYDIRTKLALIASSSDDTATAEKHLCTAKSLDPERPDPYLALADIYEKQGRKDEALAELESYAMLEQMDFGPVKRVVDELIERRDWANARRYGEMALNINPFDPDLYLALGRAYLETSSLDLALYDYDSALAVKPELRRPALAHIGKARVYLKKNDKKKAKAALDKALGMEPENAEALELKRQL